MKPPATVVTHCIACFVILAASALRNSASADATRALVTPVENTAHSLVIVADTSADAAAGIPARPPYDPTRAYVRAGCAPGRVYWRRGGGAPPDCTSTQWIESAAARNEQGNRCDSALRMLAVRGWYTAGRLRQWDATGSQWTVLDRGARGAVECEDDRGRHGAAAGAWYATDGADAPWGTNADAEIPWSDRADRYTLYSANFVAWWYGAPGSSTTTWRDAQRAAVSGAAARVPGSLTLFRHSWNTSGTTDAAAEGGMVLLGPSTRPDRATRLDALWTQAPHGGAQPLAETLDEVARLLGGQALRYGVTSHAAPATPLPSAPESQQTPGLYRTPLAATCSRVAVVAMSSTPPAQDRGALAANVVGLGADACDANVAGACAAVFARALATPRPPSALLSAGGRIDVAWFAVRPLDRTLPGLLPRIASADELAPLLDADVRAHLQGPGVAIVPDTGAQVTSVVATGGTAWESWLVASRADRWLGGLRRVRSEGGPTTGLEARPAAPALRVLVTDVAGRDLATPANAVAEGNTRLLPEHLGLDAGDETARALLIRWARGHDVDDVDGDGDRDETRDELGAFVGTPAIVRYAGNRALVFAGSSDGFLHAFDGANERWAYVPERFLRDLPSLRDAGSSGTRHAGIDGDFRVVYADVNGDRIVDPAAGDRAVIVFGLRRGGRAYYAIDVTSPESPRLLWSLGARELPGLAQTWAAPVPVRLTITGATQSAGHQAVLLVGGHDATQDRHAPRTRDRVGAAVYVVDAWTGALLWHASSRAAATNAPDLRVPELQYSIAATPRALDLDGDGEMDRAYVADTGGQVFRFDFARGARRDALARAVRIADLGGVGADDRRFYAEPDVSVVRHGPGAPYVAIVLGSGFAPDPRDVGVADRLYSLRDVVPDPLRARPTPSLVRDADLHDVTDEASRAPERGWKRRLATNGERIVVPARTADHRVLVPTWRATSHAVAADCTLAPGANRLLSVDVRDGRSLAFRVLRTDERRDSADLAGAGIVPAAAFVGAPPSASCRNRCGPRLTALLGTVEIDLDWPGSLFRSGWVEREGE